MEIELFSKILNSYLKELNIELNEIQTKQLYKYMNLLIEWNNKINLTAIIKPEEIILKHFVDSLTISKYVNNNSSIIDVGTGAGFPGIPLKIYRTDLKVTLVDSLNKRLNFINTIIEELELKNVVTVHARAEEIGKNKLYREQFDVVTSRAVANLSTLSEYLIPLAKINGKCLCMKGSEIEEELLNAKKAIDVLGGKIDKIEKFELPKSDIKRNVVLITKENKTPAKYPRKPGIPAKEPIM